MEDRRKRDRTKPPELVLEGESAKDVIRSLAREWNLNEKLSLKRFPHESQLTRKARLEPLTPSEIKELLIKAPAYRFIIGDNAVVLIVFRDSYRNARQEEQYFMHFTTVARQHRNI